MARYRKRPVVIEAVQWEGTKASFDDIMAMGDIRWEPGEMDSETFTIKTLEGDHLARRGDYIIKGIQGEFYPCKESIFIQTYELVTD